MLQEKQMSQAELRQRIRSMEGTIRAYHTEKANPEVLHRTMQFHKDQILFHKKQLEILEAREEGFEHIELMQQNLKAAKTKLAVDSSDSRATTIKKVEPVFAELYKRIVSKIGVDGLNSLLER